MCSTSIVSRDVKVVYLGRVNRTDRRIMFSSSKCIFAVKPLTGLISNLLIHLAWNWTALVMSVIVDGKSCTTNGGLLK